MKGLFELLDEKCQCDNPPGLGGCDCCWTIVMDKVEKQFGELLAAVHGDGGHHAERVGWPQAIVDGIAILYRLTTALEAYQRHQGLMCATPGCVVGNVCDPCTWIIRANDHLKVSR